MYYLLLYNLPNEFNYGVVQ